ncbi:hypothetical protein [Haloferax gibbonsii]|nr:hypothetical protein [Haloferax gibbonsii]
MADSEEIHYNFEDGDLSEWSKVWLNKSDYCTISNDWKADTSHPLSGEYSAHLQSDCDHNALATDNYVLDLSRDFEFSVSYYYEDSENRGPSIRLLETENNGSQNGERVSSDLVHNLVYVARRPTKSSGHIGGLGVRTEASQRRMNTGSKHTLRIQRRENRFRVFHDGDEMLRFTADETEVDLSKEYRLMLVSSGAWGDSSEIWFDDVTFSTGSSSSSPTPSQNSNTSGETFTFEDGLNGWSFRKRADSRASKGSGTWASRFNGSLKLAVDGAPETIQAYREIGPLDEGTQVSAQYSPERFEYSAAGVSLFLVTPDGEQITLETDSGNEQGGNEQDGQLSGSVPRDLPEGTEVEIKLVIWPGSTTIWVRKVSIGANRTATTTEDVSPTSNPTTVTATRTTTQTEPPTETRSQTSSQETSRSQLRSADYYADYEFNGQTYRWLKGIPDSDTRHAVVTPDYELVRPETARDVFFISRWSNSIQLTDWSGRVDDMMETRTGWQALGDLNRAADLTTEVAAAAGLASTEPTSAIGPGLSVVQTLVSWGESEITNPYREKISTLVEAGATSKWAHAQAIDANSIFDMSEDVIEFLTFANDIYGQLGDLRSIAQVAQTATTAYQAAGSTLSGVKMGLAAGGKAAAATAPQLFVSFAISEAVSNISASFELNARTCAVGLADLNLRIPVARRLAELQTKIKNHRATPPEVVEYQINRLVYNQIASAGWYGVSYFQDRIDESFLGKGYSTIFGSQQIADDSLSLAESHNELAKYSYAELGYAIDISRTMLENSANAAEYGVGGGLLD